MKLLNYVNAYEMKISSIVLIILMLGSCKSAQQLSDKHFFKALEKDKVNVHNRCADIAPPIELIMDSVVYKPGKTIYLPGKVKTVKVNCDSLLKSGSKNKVVYIDVPVHDTLLQTDTIYIKQERQIVDRHKEYAQAETIKLLNEQVTKLKTKKRMYMWVAIVLLAYTVARWVLRGWNIKLP